MPRTALTKDDAPGAYAGAGAALTFQAADVTNKNDFVATGRELVIVRNTDGVAAHNVTFTSADDPFNRKEDVTESIPASGFRIFGPFQLPGWIQTDGKIHLEADDAQIEFAVVVI